jgi:hypothetical protein
MRFTAAAAMCMAMLLAGLTRADVLEQAPGDALMVVKVNNLKATSDKVAKLAQDLGLAAMAGPPMQDPLGFIQQQAKMSQGVNTAGDLGFVYLDPAAAAGDDEKSFLVLIPVTDYAAFIGNWADAKTEGGVSEVKMGDSDDPGFVANWGSYAALSPSRDVVSNKPTTSMKVPAATMKELAAKDITLIGNFNALRGKLQPQLQAGREEMIKEMEQEMMADPNAAKFTPVVRSLLNQFINVVDSFLRDAEAGAVGLALNPDGLNFTVMADFKQDSYLGTTFSSVKNSTQNHLVGLPSGKYLMFGGTSSDPELAAKVLDDLALPIVRDAVAAGPEFKAVQDYYDGLRAYVAASKGTTFGMMAPSGGTPGVDPLIQVVSFQSGDAKAMMAGYKKMTMAQMELMKALGMPEDQVKTTITPAARTVDGVSFDLLQSNVNVGTGPGDQMAKEIMKMIYGGDGPNVYLGEVDGQLMMTMGMKDEAVSSAITALRGKAAPLSEVAAVKSVAANLPKANNGMMFIQVDEIVNTGLALAGQYGFKMPIQLPPDLPPVGVAMSTEGSALRIDAYVPTQLVQSLVAAGLQAAMNMRGGPGGGGI